jgi:hypothetical protein
VADDPTPAEEAAQNPAFDPWSVPLPTLAGEARRKARPSLWNTKVSGDEADRIDAEMLLEILQARPALQAAEIGAQTARRLVKATWALVGAIILLAVVAIWVG